jgi:hypothetical protein
MSLPEEMTLLVMTPTGVPLYAARGLTQTLTPVQEAKPPPRRTINGEARFLGGIQMRKYDSVITCADEFMVVDFDQSFQEYAAEYVWRLTLTEK